MKKKFFNIIQTLLLISFFIAVVSCNGSVNTIERNNSDKPVLKISLYQAEKAVLPDSDFTTFSFVLKAGETTIGSYTSSTALTDDIIDLAANGLNIGDEVTFTLTAQKDGVVWTGSTTTTLTGGENFITIRLLLSVLGTGKGSFAYTLNYSAAPTKDQVASAHLVIRSAADSTADPVFDKWYGPDLDGNAAQTAIPSDYKILVEKSDLPTGTYYVTAQLYAEAKETAKVSEWGDSIIVAAGTKSTGTGYLNVLNKAHTVTFDLNYQGSTPFVRKISYLTNMEDITPKRIGYLFKGWFHDEECTIDTPNGIDAFKSFKEENEVPLDEFTLYAKWVEFAPGAPTVTVFDTDTLYVTPENYGIGQLNYYDESEKIAWFKINTVPGNVYKICWIGYDTRGAHDFIYNNDLQSGEGDFCPSRITVYKDDATPLQLRTLTDNAINSPNSSYCDFLFTAESTQTVVALEAYTYHGAAAFRVTNYNPDAVVTDSLTGLVKVIKDDIGVSFERNGTADPAKYPFSVYIAPWSFRFSINNYSDYDSREVRWYINGKQVTSNIGGQFSLQCDDYPVGTYTLTLETKKLSNDEWYSYTAQFKITEDDHVQGE